MLSPAGPGSASSRIAAAHAVTDLIKETRIESLSQPDRPTTSLRAHRRIGDARHIVMVSDVALLKS